jgi:ribonuclease III
MSHSRLEHTLGYPFREPSLLQEALTHASLAYETQRPMRSNQRLEFLGDAVLQLVLSQSLFISRPRADEGELTTNRASLVSTKALAALAREHHIGSHLIMGRGEDANGGRDRDNILADSMEAIIGAAFMDGGMTAATTIVRKLYGDRLNNKAGPAPELNPKGLLQELIQANAAELPRYAITSETGPAHSRTFHASVTWRGLVIGQGEGRSKKDAEMDAARAAIKNPALSSHNQDKLEIQENDPPYTHPTGSNFANSDLITE